MTDPVNKGPVFSIHATMLTEPPDWAKVEIMMPSVLVHDLFKFVDDLRIKMQNAH